MFNFLGSFLSGSLTRLILTAREIQYALIIVGFLTIIGILPPFLGAPVRHSFYLAVPIAIFSVYRLCGLRRYLTIHILGETADVAINVVENQSLLDNDLAVAYRRLIVYLLLAQSSIFILAAVAFNHLDGSREWLPAMIIIFFIISLWTPRFSIWVSGVITAVSVLFILGIAIHEMVPSVSRIPIFSRVVVGIKANGIASANARVLEDIDTLREKQRQRNLAKVIEKANTWQEANPGREFPENIKKELEAAKVGLTVTEYEAKVKAETAEAEAKKAEAKAAAETKAASEAKVSAEAKAIAEAKSTKEATEKRAVSANPIKRLLCFKKLEDYVGINPDIKEGCNEIIDFNHVGGLIEFKIQTDNVNMNCLYTGQEVGERKFKGNWVQQGPGGRTGTWEMEFFPGFDYGVGVQRNDCDPTPIPSVVRKG